VAKPTACPFCGQTPELNPTDWRAEGDAWAAVTCETDDCPVNPELRVWANVKESGAKGHAAQKRVAIQRWNRALRTHGSAKTVEAKP
jgi:hypothetical protein